MLSRQVQKVSRSAPLECSVRPGAIRRTSVTPASRATTPPTSRTTMWQGRGTPRRCIPSRSDAPVPALERWVYFFGPGRADGSAAMRDILGGKGAGLAEMANLGLPVPPGFTISAKLCLTYLEQGTFPDELREEGALLQVGE